MKVEIYGDRTQGLTFNAGDPVILEGSVKMLSYETPSGIKQKRPVLQARKWTLLGGDRLTTSSQSAPQATKTTPPPAPAPMPEVMDFEEIPF